MNIFGIEPPKAPELQENPLIEELRTIREELRASRIAWSCLVEELYHSGQLNHQHLKNRIDGDMWIPNCRDELMFYSGVLQDLPKTAKEVEETIHQDNSNIQGIVNSPNSSISDSFNSK